MIIWLNGSKQVLEAGEVFENPVYKRLAKRLRDESEARIYQENIEYHANDLFRDAYLKNMSCFLTEPILHKTQFFTYCEFIKIGEFVFELSRVDGQNHHVIYKLKKEPIKMTLPFKPTDGAGAEKLKNHLQIETSALGARVADLLNYWMRDIFNLVERQLKKTDWTRSDYIEFQYRGELDSFGYIGFTGLMVLAHDLGIKIEVSASNFALLKFKFSERESGATYTLEDHISSFRRAYGLAEPNKPRAVAAAPRNKTPMSLEQAVAILNAGAYKTKECGLSEVIWEIYENNQIRAFLKHDKTKTIVDFGISSATAIHRARQLWRRAPQISVLRQTIENEIMSEKPEMPKLNN